jgi:hypothetical protein
MTDKTEKAEIARLAAVFGKRREMPKGLPSPSIKIYLSYRRF